jgi:hypothetical protein
MRAALLIAALIVIGPAAASAQRPAGSSLHTFLQREFRDLRADRTARYMLAWADLDGDRRPEAIVYLQAQGYCGTGGCTLFIYRAEGRSWRRVADQPTNQLPIRVLNARHHGWRDIASRARMLVSDHFVRYEERMIFNGRTYPVAATTHMMRPLPGQVVIRENDRGRPLF